MNYKFSIQADAKLSAASLANIKSQLNQLGKNAGIKIDTSGITNAGNAFKSATRESKTFFNTLQADAKKVLEWTLATSAIFAVVGAIRSSIEAAVEFDKTLVNLQIVTGDTREQTEALMLTYNKMAQELGATTQQVATSANEFLRQGLSVSDTNKMIEASTYLSKLGMIDSADATQYLTSMTKGYQLSAEDAMGIVDKLTKVDMQAAVSAGYIAEAFSKTSTSAKLAGVDMDTLAGYIATIGQVTQKSASTVGQSINLGAVAA